MMETAHCFSILKKRYKECICNKGAVMVFFRQYILPFLIVIVFLVALFVVSARNFLPGDMVAPAPVGLVISTTWL